MPTESVGRKLAAILAADVAGYSRLMGLDEEGTLRTLKQHRKDFVDPTIEAHHGHIVKTTGDGLLVEFASTVDAVSCAVAVQKGMAERNADIPFEGRIEFRIGINVGDVLVDDDDIFGDAVNIAARLEGLARPGGICVSRLVRDQVRDRIQLIFNDHGEQSVKNIERPVRVFGVRLDPGFPPQVAKRAHIVAPTSRLSIVVLPFENLSNDPDQEYFADGLVEDLTTDLSRIAGSFVIARNTAFTYKGKPVDAKQIGRELDVNYMLEGSVRRLGKKVRINVQLIDTQTGGHIWANRFDGEIDDLFALQDSVTSTLAMTLSLELVEAGAQRASQKTNPDAVDLVLRGRAAGLRPRSRENVVEAAHYYEEALRVAPNSWEAKIGLAEVLVGSAWPELTNWFPPQSRSTPTAHGHTT